MKSLLEIHLLQNVAPSNLNRDDTGSPKDAYFGGVRRGRISSQSLKRAMRMYFSNEALIPEINRSLRTKRLTQKLVALLHDKRGKSELTQQIVNFALGGLQLTVTTDEKEGKTQYLVFLGNAELEALASVISEYWDELAAKLPEEKDDTKKPARAAKQAAKGAVPTQVSDALNKVLDGGKAVDVALFGRMLADLPSRSRDAASQVAHAISTHKIEHNEDFYTAVDDLKPEDNAGADMLGTVEFNSACYYRYAVIDLAKLRSNLDKDDELLLKGVEAFLRASIYALPSGKQNSFAAHQLPSFIGLTVRRDASPRSLANAFEKPVGYDREGLVHASAKALVKEWNTLEAVFGQGGASYVVNLTEVPLEGVLANTQSANVETLLANTLEQVRTALAE